MRWGLIPFSTSLSSGLSTASGTLNEKQFTICSVEIGGVTGFGELSVSPSLQAGNLEDNIKMLTKQFASWNKNQRTFLDKETVMHWVNNEARILSLPAQAAVSTALLDAASKNKKCSLASFLQIPMPVVKKTCYTLGRNQAEESLPPGIEGYAAIKIKTDCSFLDIQRLRGISKTASLPLWIDVENTTIRRGGVKEFLNSFPAGYLEVLEDPCEGNPADNWRDFNKEGVLVFADRAIKSLSDIKKYAPYIDGVVIKPLRLGGIFPSLCAIKTARELGLKTMLGCYVETTLAISAWFQLSGLVDYIDLDGNTLLLDSPCQGVEQTGHGLAPSDNSDGIGIHIEI